MNLSHGWVDVGVFQDSIAGDWLQPELVREARKEDMAQVRKHWVYDKVDVKDCYGKTVMPPTGTRWADMIKGEIVHPECRPRLVAQKINTERRGDLFAATPPVEAKKVIMSMAHRIQGCRQGERGAARFHRREAGVLSRQAQEGSTRGAPAGRWEEGACETLRKAMYGTRDAAQSWEYAYVEALENIALQRGNATPCAFYTRDRELRLVVRGDDFTVLGWDVQCDCLRRKIRGVFEV